MNNESEVIEENKVVKDRAKQSYKEGFSTDIEAFTIPPGLDEDTIRLISSKKDEPEWLLEYRLDAFRKWQEMETPEWAKLNIPEIDFQAIRAGSGIPASNADYVIPQPVHTAQSVHTVRAYSPCIQPSPCIHPVHTARSYSPARAYSPFIQPSPCIQPVHTA